MAASICVIGVALFIIQFYLGIGECLRLLQTIFEIGIEDLSFIQNYRINYLTLAVLTLVLAILVVSTDFLRSDARNSPYPICMFCMGSAPSLVVSVVVACLIIYNSMIFFLSNSLLCCCTLLCFCGVMCFLKFARLIFCTSTSTMSATQIIQRLNSQMLMVA